MWLSKHYIDLCSLDVCITHSIRESKPYTRQNSNTWNTNAAKHDGIGVFHWQIGSQAIDTVLVDAICTWAQLNIIFIAQSHHNTQQKQDIHQ